MAVNIFLFLFGASIGSFLNVLIWRWPREESIIYPSSHCPKCSAAIKRHDNIPVISYILLGGRCRACKAPISLRYPIVEFLTGVLFILINSLLGFRASDFVFWLYAVFLSSLIVAFFSDYETEIIPDEIILFGIPLGLLFYYLSGNIAASIIGCASGYSLLFLISLLGKYLFKKEALGYGDVKLAALMGAWLSWDRLLLAILLGYLLGSIWAILLLAFRIKKMGDYIPFAPPLAVGAAISLFFGNNIINFYIAHFF